jgi:hypothetical protein
MKLPRINRLKQLRFHRRHGNVKWQSLALALALALALHRERVVPYWIFAFVLFL